MNVTQMKMAMKELLKQANDIVNEAMKESMFDRMNANNIERLKIEVYKALADKFVLGMKVLETESKPQ
jgi:hypothetical protein